MKNVSDKSCTGNQNTNFMFETFFFSSENRVVYEMWKKCGKPDKPQMIQYGAFVLHVG